MSILPQILTHDQYRAVYEQDASWLAAVHAIAQRHHLVGTPERLALGTHVVFGIGESVVKLFCPLWQEDLTYESAALRAVVDLPTPQILAQGELEGWGYLILNRVSGRPTGDIWDQLSLAERHSLVGQIGQLLRQLHAQSLPADLDHDWHAFLAQRLRTAEIHHGAEEPWKGWIRSMVADFQEPPHPCMLLHADLTRDHFFVDRADNGGWFVSSIIDFGDARIGHPFYDFVAILADHTLGQPELTHSLLTAYGLELSRPTAQSLMSYCFLHEFCSLAGFQGELSMESPDDFLRALWGDAG